MDRISTAGFKTEIDFTLPKGFIDETGVLHKRGVMRLATAADEILPLRDPRVQANPAYLTVIVLARVVTALGSVAHIDTQLIESLFACDIEYLRRLYEEINAAEEPDAALVQPAAAARANGRTAGGLTVLGEA
ncbi:hypothetical protein [Sphingomonas bacterium]|uniref:hypothetical protein n=1 Tax=Sphingomonas bacterium TaxID=1895847 RepID=UPI0026336ADA|nr:hypothetical protein [Sphingomonas bacterium]MDB5678522.1 hypothetical protein [Sphingomonas bacterium]